LVATPLGEEVRKAAVRRGEFTDGAWERLLARAQTNSDAVGEVEWEVSIDSTVVPFETA
jgi:hypothetical protein